LSKEEEAYTFGKKTIDFCLGSHENLGSQMPKNFSFVIGYNALGGGTAKYPQHMAAFGCMKTDCWGDFSSEASRPGSLYKKLLVGALVGGPKSACSNYNDNINDYVTNEVCIYYNAHIVGCLAYMRIKEGVVQTAHHFSPQAVSRAQNVTTLKIQANASFTVPEIAGARALISVYDVRGKRIGAFSAAPHSKFSVHQRLGTGAGTCFVTISAQ
jgi:hypothetical protein